MKAIVYEGFFIARMNTEDLTTVGEFVATGKVTPVIDKRYMLSEAADAFRYVATGHTRGKVVITVDCKPEALIQSP